MNDQLIKEVSQSNKICEKNNTLNASINEKNNFCCKLLGKFISF